MKYLLIFYNSNIVIPVQTEDIVLTHGISDYMRIMIDKSITRNRDSVCIG